MFLSRPSIVKERFPKLYRHPVLDRKLSVERLRQEARSIVRCRKAGVDTPIVYHVDFNTNRLFLEEIDGYTVKQFLYENYSLIKKDLNECTRICTALGHNIAKIHDADIIHGDLTTSNFMLRRATHSLVVIDFGLSYISSLAEDKAVDLYVLERAFLSTHPNSEELFETVMKSYENSSKKSPQVIKKLEQVRQRGRKKLAFG